MKQFWILLILFFIPSNVSAIPQGNYFSPYLKVGDTFEWQITKFNTSETQLNSIFKVQDMISITIIKNPDEFINQNLNDYMLTYKNNQAFSKLTYDTSLAYLYEITKSNDAWEYTASIKMEFIIPNMMIDQNGDASNLFNQENSIWSSPEPNIVHKKSLLQEITAYNDTGVVKEAIINLDDKLPDEIPVFTHIEYHLIEKSDIENRGLYYPIITIPALFIITVIIRKYN